jgi:radical SAM protein with 4Fe4S-binding SPASM domain
MEDRTRIPPSPPDQVETDAEQIARIRPVRWQPIPTRARGRSAAHADVVLPRHDVALPRHVQIEPVGQCNLRCAMCPIELRPESEPGRPPAHMPPAVFRRLVEAFGTVEELHLQGLGEPLLHPQFFELVAHAARRGIRVSTNTNMTLMTEARAAACVASGLHDLHVSLDAATAATFEAIRRRASFRKVLRNLRRLMAARAAASSALPHVHLVAVAMRRNLDQLPALVRLAHAEGVESLSVQHLCHDFAEAALPERYRPMRSFVEAETLLGEEPVRVEAAFGQARAEAERLGVPLRLPSIGVPRHGDDVPGRKRCDSPWRSAYVSHDGQAMPCCMVSTPDRASFGNMAEEGVAAVWGNDAYQSFRDALASAEPPDVCRGCAVYRAPTSARCRNLSSSPMRCSLPCRCRRRRTSRSS